MPQFDACDACFERYFQVHTNSRPPIHMSGAYTMVEPGFTHFTSSLPGGTGRRASHAPAFATATPSLDSERRTAIALPAPTNHTCASTASQEDHTTRNVATIPDNTTPFSTYQSQRAEHTRAHVRPNILKSDNKRNHLVTLHITYYAACREKQKTK